MIRRPPRSTRFPCTTLFRSFGLPFPRQARGVRTKSGPKLNVNKFNPNADVFNPFQIITVKGEAEFWVEPDAFNVRSEEHTSELQSRQYLVCRLLLENKNAHN